VRSRIDLVVRLTFLDLTHNAGNLLILNIFFKADHFDDFLQNDAFRVVNGIFALFAPPEGINRRMVHPLRLLLLSLKFIHLV